MARFAVVAKNESEGMVDRKISSEDMASSLNRKKWLQESSCTSFSKWSLLQ